VSVLCGVCVCAVCVVCDVCVVYVLYVVCVACVCMLCVCCMWYVASGSPTWPLSEKFHSKQQNDYLSQTINISKYTASFFFFFLSLLPICLIKIISIHLSLKANTEMFS